MDSPGNELVWIIEISPLVSHETGLSRMKDSRERSARFCLFHNTLDDPSREKHSQSSLASMPYPHFLLLYPHSWQRNRIASGSVNEQESSPVTMLHLRSHRRWWLYHGGAMQNGVETVLHNMNAPRWVSISIPLSLEQQLQVIHRTPVYFDSFSVISSDALVTKNMAAREDRRSWLSIRGGRNNPALPWLIHSTS